METSIVERQKMLTEKLAKAGLSVDRRLGMNILKHEEGQTLLVRITSEVLEFQAKGLDDEGKPKVYQYVLVDNLETGETGLAYWLSGQIVYNLKNQKDGFIGGCFAITHLGQTKVDGMRINQFDIFALTEKN